MTGLDLLHALHGHPTLTFHRVGEGLKVLPAVPEEARPVLAHFKPAIVQALGDGERLEAQALFSSPFRLAALLAHALGLEGPVVLTLYGKGEQEPHRYLVPPETLTPHLTWASQNLPPPRRLHLAATSGAWILEVQGGWEVALEAQVARTRYLLLHPGLEARAWLEAAHKGLVPPEELSVWRRGEAPFTARGWGEALAHLEEVAHASR
ncbi:hypothetical protein [Thermus islandicus]|uniref:hypothetical protein n=1 Tax=Thermus islandicus TaxID=540988 RepID=UPI0003B4FA99|nr:hypothetical protein [Thermus islandicus]